MEASASERDDIALECRLLAAEAAYPALYDDIATKSLVITNAYSSNRRVLLATDGPVPETTV